MYIIVTISYFELEEVKLDMTGKGQVKKVYPRNSHCLYLKPTKYSKMANLANSSYLHWSPSIPLNCRSLQAFPGIFFKKAFRDYNLF